MAADKPADAAAPPPKADAAAAKKDGKGGKDEDKVVALSAEDVRIMTSYGATPYSARVRALEAEIKALAKRVNDVAGVKESDTGLAHPSRWDLVTDKQMMQEEHPLQVCGLWVVLGGGLLVAGAGVSFRGCAFLCCAVLPALRPDRSCSSLLASLQIVLALNPCPPPPPHTHPAPPPPQVARCTKIISPGSDDAKYVINIKQIAKFVVGLGDKVAPTDVEEGMRVGVDRQKYQVCLLVGVVVVGVVA
jgi:26S proteasome regulatory subunit T1